VPPLPGPPALELLPPVVDESSSDAFAPQPAIHATDKIVTPAKLRRALAAESGSSLGRDSRT
jgi:hypothetical protein